MYVNKEDMLNFEIDIERLGSFDCHKVVFATVTELVMVFSITQKIICILK